MGNVGIRNIHWCHKSDIIHWYHRWFDAKIPESMKNVRFGFAHEMSWEEKTSRSLKLAGINLAPGVLRDPLSKNRNNEEHNTATYWVCFSSLYACSLPHAYTYITFMCIHACKYAYTKRDNVLQLERKPQAKTIVLFIGWALTQISGISS